MSDINKIFLTGRAGADPEMKYFESGAVSTNISVAVEEYKGKDTTPITHWVRLKAWSKKAEYLGSYAKKGSLLFVEGSLRVESYKNQDGETKSYTYVLVDNVKIIDKLDKSGGEK